MKNKPSFPSLSLSKNHLILIQFMKILFILCVLLNLSTQLSICLLTTSTQMTFLVAGLTKHIAVFSYLTSLKLKL
jgi:hypothetical protein